MKALPPLAALISTAAAKCACGYTVNSTASADYALFTDLLETDFLHLQSVAFNSTYNSGWIPQNYNTSSTTANGPYGMAKETSNLVSNYISNAYDWGSPGIKGGDAGLQLWVRSQLVGPADARLIPSAELVSQGEDILYGSFRVAMKKTSVSGTCSAFFFYRNDSQEIDVEILSSEVHNASSSATASWPVHLVVQNTSNTVSTGGKADYAGSTQDIPALPAANAAEYNEYRFDWLPGRISYYINGAHTWTTTENVPSTAGRVHLSHWSDGNSFWSGGPPAQDAVTTVSYVKAYFNSSSATRNGDYERVCPSGAVKEQTCEIPTQMAPPNPFGAHGNVTGRTFFFTERGNMTPGQVVYNSSHPKESMGSSLQLMEASVFSGFAFVTFMALVGMWGFDSIA